MSEETEKPTGEHQRRPYTMSEAALEQRRSAAALSTGPRTEDGKAGSSRNAWKHGQFSELHKRAFVNGLTSMGAKFGKPCLTSCPVHPDNSERKQAPCSLVTSGRTKAGDSCLDKSVYVDVFDAILTGLEESDTRHMHGVMAAEIASAVQLVHELRESVARDGVQIVIPAIDKDGEVIYDANGNIAAHKVLLNPVIPQIFKALEVLGINMPELMLTPRAKEKARTEDEQSGALAKLLGAAQQRLGVPRPMLPKGGDSE
jgi:hypothetical protein